MHQLAHFIASAATVHSLYPPGHPRLTRSLEVVQDALQKALLTQAEDSITYLLVGDDLVVGEELVRNIDLPMREFVGLLRRRNIERLTFARGATIEELNQLIDSLVTGDPVQSTEHVVAGSASLVMEEKKEENVRHELTTERLEIVREAWAAFRVKRAMPVEHMEQLVWSLIDSLANNTRAMLPLAPLKSYDEYTFVHSINVSLLVLAQARAFGISGSVLHEFGMAGLLHDVGKLSVPLEVLNKPGALNSHEWEVMKNHTKEGAWYLGELAGTAPLAAVVAFEHHLRYDTRANYPVLRQPRLPNLASRMTAIADTYDAMLTIRPYQEAVGRATAIEILRMRSGSHYDPVLVSNFLKIV